MGTTQSGDLGRSEGGSQQDPSVGTQVGGCLAHVRTTSHLSVRYADSYRIVNVSFDALALSIRSETNDSVNYTRSY